jgi:hypothetical protein
VAAVALVDVGALDPLPREPFDLRDLRGQRVAVVGVALVLRPPPPRGGHRHNRADLLAAVVILFSRAVYHPLREFRLNPCQLGIEPVALAAETLP